MITLFRKIRTTAPSKFNLNNLLFNKVSNKTEINFNMTSLATEANLYFSGIKDRFNGIIVKSKEEPCSRDVMKNKLTASLNKWTAEKVRGIWFEIDNENAEWIPELIQNGFMFHHANPELSVLLKWLPTEENCPIPSYAHTMVGVGAMVIDNDNNILVVQEKYYKQPHWKLPGGYVDPGESLMDAAKREVLEETGIETEFDSLFAVRHIQPSICEPNWAFGCSDFYFVVRLKPKSAEIKMCERELANAQWMKLEDYTENPIVNAMNKLIATKLLATLKGGATSKISSLSSLHPMLNAQQQLYYLDV